MSCGKGCSDIYINEWISDPPDCCDPCDKCQDQFTGPHGYCCRGPFQRILSAIHCYKYCPPPNCGPWKPIFGHCGCGNGCGGCGDIGCSTCAGGATPGGEVYYEGATGPAAPRPTPSTKAPSPAPMQGEPTSILEENWDAPRVKPQPGKPIHNAQQP